MAGDVLGHFVPYHKLAVLVAVITTVVFSIAFSHSIVFEAKTSVIDLDQTRWSAGLIEKVNASPYVSIVEVLHTPAEVRSMVRNDRSQAVLYIPKGAEEHVTKGDRQVHLGLYLDDSNSAQNGELTSRITSIVNELGAETAIGRGDGVSSLGANSEETRAMIAPLALGTRSITNPTSQSTTGTTANFLIFFSTMYQGLCALMLVGRLKVGHRWGSAVLPAGLAAFLTRAVPYAFVYMAVVMAALAVLVTFGQMRFAGNPALFALALFLTGLANVWVAVLLSWNAQNPGDGAGKMIFLVPPGFILGGMTFALTSPHEFVQWAAWGIPLSWIFKFWRDQGLRGVTVSDDLALLGAMLVYLAALALLVGMLFWRAQAKRRIEVEEAWRDLAAVKRPGERQEERPEESPDERPEPVKAEAPAR